MGRQHPNEQGACWTQCRGIDLPEIEILFNILYKLQLSVFILYLTRINLDEKSFTLWFMVNIIKILELNDILKDMAGVFWNN